MDPKELRGLMEAYTEVYAPQESIDEGLRSAVKRLLSGGKKEAEAPKPQGRTAELRQKHGVTSRTGPESPRGRILSRMQKTIDADAKKHGPESSAVKTSTAARNKMLRGGFSQYEMNREEFEFIVNALIDEGYDLSSYTWDEIYEICLDEAVKGADPEMRRAAAAERRSGDKPLPAKEGEKYADFKKAQVAYIKRKMKEELEQIDESGLSTDTIRSAIKKGNKRTDARMDAGDVAGATKSMTNVDRSKRALAKKDPGRTAGTPHFPAGSTSYKEELDIFDTVLEFLQVEGYAETLEEAEWMMANVIDEEAIGIILGEALTGERYKKVMKKPGGTAYSRKVSADPAKRATRGGRGGESDFGAGDRGAGNKAARRAGTYKEYNVNEAQAARENPEKYEREQAKKSAPVRGERTPMPPRGDKRREDFEKWYAANVR